MNANVRYLPGAEDSMIADKVVRVASSIKKDVGIYLGYRERLGENEKVEELASNCKSRILTKLALVAHMQETHIKDNNEWKAILKKALSKVYKHKNSPEFRLKLKQLFDEYELDTTNSKVHFVRAYMECIGRMSPEQISSPFHQ